jgi:hypothetical protein
MVALRYGLGLCAAAVMGIALAMLAVVVLASLLPRFFRRRVNRAC